MDEQVRAWAQRALCELNAHLHRQAPELRELEVAGTPLRTIFTLYPFDAADYVQGVYRLIRRHALAHCRGMLEDLVAQAHSAFPYELAAFLPAAYRDLWSSQTLAAICVAQGIELAEDMEDAYSFYNLFRFLMALNALARPEPAENIRDRRGGLDYAAEQVPAMMPVAALLLRRAQRFLPAA